jgi:hypothetical protein
MGCWYHMQLVTESRQLRRGQPRTLLDAWQFRQVYFYFCRYWEYLWYVILEICVQE